MDDTTHLGNLLAMIHGDGGHYQDEHGTDKAVVDAIEKYYSLRADQEAAEDAAANYYARVLELEAEIKAAADAREKWRQLWTASPVDEQKVK